VVTVSVPPGRSEPTWTARVKLATGFGPGVVVPPLSGCPPPGLPGVFLAESPADAPCEVDAFGPVRPAGEPFASLQAEITTTMAAVISVATRLVTTRFILPPRSVRLVESNMPSGTSINGREVTAGRM
jgi:hypothetical protein